MLLQNFKLSSQKFPAFFHVLLNELDYNFIPMQQVQIIGIFLIRNEDRFIEQAIQNVLDFCDQLLLVDHGSKDKTLFILNDLHKRHPKKIKIYQIKHPRESHDLLKKFVGTSTWVFGIDGDEIYDLERLQTFRTRLLAGDFEDSWMLLGNVLHVDKIEYTTVSGYLAPPSRSITKLYNFAAIDSWDGNTLERLHGGHPQFREGFHEQKKRQLQHEYSWENAPLRCLHLCFLSRSSLQKTLLRKNIMETYGVNLLSSLFKRLISFFSSSKSSWKQKHYRRGARYTFDAKSFFNKKFSEVETIEEEKK